MEKMETELAGLNTLSYSTAHSSPRFFPDCTIALVIPLQQKQREITLSHNRIWLVSGHLIAFVL